MEEKLSQLKTLVAEIVDLGQASAVLVWDQQTYMPPGAAEARANQLACIRKLLQERATAPELVELLDMQDIAERRTEGFSEGQRAKVAIARALVHDPHNVILDEPTAGLDVMSSRRMRDTIRKLRDAGKCILFSTHQMHEVAELCERVVLIADGVVKTHATPAELLESTGHDDPSRQHGSIEAQFYSGFS